MHKSYAVMHRGGASKHDLYQPLQRIPILTTPVKVTLAPSIAVRIWRGTKGPSKDIKAVVKLRHIVNEANALVQCGDRKFSAINADVMVIQTASAIPSSEAHVKI